MVDLFEELAEGVQYVHRKLPGLTLLMDLNKLSHDEVRQALDEAIHALGDGKQT